MIQWTMQKIMEKRIKINTKIIIITTMKSLSRKSSTVTLNYRIAIQYVMSNAILMHTMIQWTMIETDGCRMEDICMTATMTLTMRAVVPTRLQMSQYLPCIKMEKVVNKRWMHRIQTVN